MKIRPFAILSPTNSPQLQQQQLPKQINDLPANLQDLIFKSIPRDSVADQLDMDYIYKSADTYLDLYRYQIPEGEFS